MIDVQFIPEAIRAGERLFPAAPENFRTQMCRDLFGVGERAEFHGGGEVKSREETMRIIVRAARCRKPKVSMVEGKPAPFPLGAMPSIHPLLPGFPIGATTILSWQQK
jgi:hypothetical protein